MDYIHDAEYGIAVSVHRQTDGNGRLLRILVDHPAFGGRVSIDNDEVAHLREAAIEAADKQLDLDNLREGSIDCEQCWANLPEDQRDSSEPDWDYFDPCEAHAPAYA